MSKFEPTILCDIRSWDYALFPGFDMVWASPVCTEDRALRVMRKTDSPAQSAEAQSSGSGGLLAAVGAHACKKNARVEFGETGVEFGTGNRHVQRQGAVARAAKHIRSYGAVRGAATAGLADRLPG